jgi:hypothetical protein
MDMERLLGRIDDGGVPLEIFRNLSAFGLDPEIMDDSAGGRRPTRGRSENPAEGT